MYVNDYLTFQIIIEIFQVKIISLEAENTTALLEVKQRETNLKVKAEEQKKLQAELDRQISNSSELLHQFLSAEDKIASLQGQVQVRRGKNDEMLYLSLSFTRSYPINVNLHV